MILRRPHISLFDDSHTEDAYRRDIMLQKLNRIDCLIVIDSNLQTMIANQLLGQAYENQATIIEIGENPQIKMSGVNQLVGKSETIVPKLCKILEDYVLKIIR
jgi:NAD-dependent SIR2 family protein deacetylase